MVSDFVNFISVRLCFPVANLRVMVTMYMYMVSSCSHSYWLAAIGLIENISEIGNLMI